MPVDRLTRSQAQRAETGIVHLGLGAFFRAFGCIYVAEAMAASGGDWGIIGVSLRSPDTRDALRPQGWAYTAVTQGPKGQEARMIEVLNNALVAPEDPGAVLDAMADPDVKIVSLTITEKGYCHIPATGALDREHPDIAHDLSQSAPRSAVGFLVRALQRRRAAGDAPFTVLSCDNLPDNGATVRGVVLEFAQLVDSDLADWISEFGRFPATMVDRITPATTVQDIQRVADLTGRFDAAPVLHEPFRQWAIEDRFVNGMRPDFAAAGVEMVADVGPHEQMKLRMLNGTHSALAYTGYLAGHETISQVVADPVFAAYVRNLWREIVPAVTAPEGVDLEQYADALFDRYTNPAIQHRTWQIAMDGSQKLPQRLLHTLRENLSAGRPSPAICLAVVGWMRYVCGSDETDQPIDVRDPLAQRLRALTSGTDEPDWIVASLLGVREVFPADLAETIEPHLLTAAKHLWADGTRNTISTLVQ